MFPVSGWRWISCNFEELEVTVNSRTDCQSGEFTHSPSWHVLRNAVPKTQSPASKFWIITQVLKAGCCLTEELHSRVPDISASRSCKFSTQRDTLFILRYSYWPFKAHSMFVWSVIKSYTLLKSKLQYIISQKQLIQSSECYSYIGFLWADMWS
jgi:hypothetical protein